MPSVTGNNEMKEIVDKLEARRRDHEDGIKYMNLRKLREMVSLLLRIGIEPFVSDRFVSYVKDYSLSFFLFIRSVNAMSLV